MCFASSVRNPWCDALALVSPPSFLLPLCQELRAHIPHALLAQPEKYGTVTATVLPDCTGTLMRRLIALIQAASTATSPHFYSFTGPPSVLPYMCLSLSVFAHIRSVCSVYSLPLCRRRTCRGSTIKESLHCLVTVLPGSGETLILLISTSVLTAGSKAPQTCHYLSSADIHAC